MKAACTTMPMARSCSSARSFAATLPPLPTALSSALVGNSKPRKAASSPIARQRRSSSGERLTVVERVQAK